MLRVVYTVNCICVLNNDKLHTQTKRMQVFTEQRQLAILVGLSSTPELEEAQKEVLRLQNELKVRTKLNKLQSSKVSTYCVPTMQQQVVSDNMWPVTCSKTASQHHTFIYLYRLQKGLRGAVYESLAPSAEA